MRRIMIYLFILSFTFGIFNTRISAIECDYPDAGLKITYDANSKVIYDYDKFSNGDYYRNYNGLFKSGQAKFDKSEIADIDQEIWKKYKGESCPSNIILCEYSDWSYKPIPSTKGLALKLGEAGRIFACKVGMLDEDTCKQIDNDTYAMFTIDKKELYIFDYEGYEKSGLEKYKDGALSNDFKDGFNKGYNICTDGGKNKGLAWVTWGDVCGTIGGVMNSQVEFTLRDGYDALYYRKSTCNKVKYEGPYPSFDANCALLQQYKVSYESAVGNYKGCDEDQHCKTTSLKDMNNIEEQLKTYCTSVLRNYDYNEFQESCINDCLTLKHDLNELRKGTDLYESYGDVSDSCSIGSSIISMVYNVLKWAKYILPAIIIILTMLDFIKAIAAQNDDDMKKAQGKFVKRLIVAALFFLLPLIINFVLQTFGFYDQNCDITALFKK